MNEPTSPATEQRAARHSPAAPLRKGRPNHDRRRGTDETITPVLSVRDLTVRFGAFCAVESVSIDLRPGRTLAVVGESGCGKSMTALAIMRLLPHGAHVAAGSIRLRDRDLLALGPRDMLAVRGGEIAMIFQEPMTSLNPVFSIGEQIIEAVRRHQGLRGRAARMAAIDALREVGIADAEARLRSAPHEFSGGMRQRVMIAMALACRPSVLLADEPTTALDVSTQVQTLDLLAKARRQRGLAMMLISHDLRLVERHADAVCVMYAGRMVEKAPADALFERPMHPYTRALLACRPVIGQRRARLSTVDQILRAPGAFDPVAGTDCPPWWPDAGQGGGACVLRAVDDEHWVGCADFPESR